MAHRQHHHHDILTSTNGPVALTHNARPTEPLHLVDEEAILDVDEPPDNHLMFRRQPIRSPTLSNLSNPLDGVLEQNKQKSLLTQGLSSERAVSAPRPRSIISSYSNDSFASTAELTSDGGLTSPARTSTPSPPPPSTAIHGPKPMLKKSDTVLVKAPEASKKRCITFACGRPPAQKIEEPKKDTEVKKPCTIKFACPARPQKVAVSDPLPKESVKPVLVVNSTTASTQFPDQDDTTPKKLSPKLLSRSPVAKKKRPSEALRFHEFASKELPEDEWISEQPRRQSRITISDTLRKENEYRKLGQEAAAEAREAELEEDEEAMNAEDGEDNDDDDFDEDLDDEDDQSDDDSDGNESDNEAGFADSDDDDEIEENSDYQFWTPGLTTAATSTDHLEHIRLKRRTASQSSIESVVTNRHSQDVPRSPEVKKHRKLKIKMRPETPELPDSTDFVCGTLDEDRPLEAAYKANLELRKREKQGVIPQDLDPSFPTSDPEDKSDEEEEDDENDSGNNSQEGTWAAGQFDDFEIERERGRRTGSGKARSPSPVSPRRMRSPAPTKRLKSPAPRRSKSPAPKRSKSPAPLAIRNRAMAHTPPPTRRLFGQSPKRARSPTTRPHPVSPPTSRHPSYDDRCMEVPLLAQRPNRTHTKSLPRTPNPFWQEHRRVRKELAAQGPDASTEMHSRGPIDIVQGLEKKRQRRKEKFWLTHCRKEAKEREKRRQPPGRGAKRMRELGLEAADRCKGYGPRTQLVLSI